MGVPGLGARVRLGKLATIVVVRGVVTRHDAGLFSVSGGEVASWEERRVWCCRDERHWVCDSRICIDYDVA